MLNVKGREHLGLGLLEEEDGGFKEEGMFLERKFLKNYQASQLRLRTISKAKVCTANTLPNCLIKYIT